jgi:hypothetical protein
MGDIVGRVREMADKYVPMAAARAGISLIDQDVITMTWLREREGQEKAELVPVMVMVVIFRGPGADSEPMFQWNMVNHWYPDDAWIQGAADQVCIAAKGVFDAAEARAAQAANGHGHVPGAGLRKLDLRPPGSGGLPPHV